MRRNILILSVSLLFAGSIPSIPQEKSVYPIAVWYGGGKARAPMQESNARAHRAVWKKDLEQIRELGFPAVKTWVEWASSERTEGKHDLDNLEQLLELADETGLRVIIQVYVDSAPDWVGEKFPDGRFVAQNGAAIPSQAAPGYCTDHPEIAKRVAAFYRAVAGRAVKHSSFYAYDLWSEPHIINWAVINYIPDAQFCFCRHTMAKFRIWLERKYGSLGNLNAAWYRSFERWEQVEPPRFGTILSYSDFIDWKTFIADKLADDLRERKEAVKGVDPGHLATSHAAVPCLFTSPFAGDGTPDDWKMAAAADFYGTSIYPKHSSSAAPWSTLRRAGALDFIRGSGMKNDGFFIGELQAGFGTTGVKVGEPVTPEDMEDWIWTVTARGARSISIYAYYPMSSGYESGGYGLVELDGTLTPRSKRAGSIAAILNRHGDFFLKAKPAAAEAAILYNPAAHLVGGEQSGGIRGGVRDSMFGYYRTFFDRNVPVDFVHVMDLESGNWGKYKLLIVPYAVMLSSKASAEIDKFVQGGGRVLAEARTAWNDERGWATPVIPGSGLHETFGCRELEVRPKARTTIRMTGTIAQGGSASAASPIEFGGAIYEEVLKVIGVSARVVGTFPDGAPALVLNQHGKGAALFAGSFLGVAHETQPSPGFDQFTGQVLQWAGIAAPVIVRDASGRSAPEIRLMNHEEGSLLLIFNREATERKLDLELIRIAPIKSLQPWTEDTPAALAGDGRALTITIPARRVAAIYLN
jgi:beta-galactosidase